MPLTDPVARLILDEAGDLRGARVFVLDDRDAELATGAAAAGAAEVRWWGDDVRDDPDLPGSIALPEIDAGTDLVLARLPRALDRLDEYSRELAARAPGARIVAGARVKHMTRSMNAVLERHWRQVRASLGRDRSRVLHATDARPIDPDATNRWPREATVQTPGGNLTLVHHGGVFAGGRLDPGTRLLLQALAQARPSPGRAHDLGSGTGVLGLWLARSGHRVSASDISRFAVASTRQGARVNDVSIEVRLADGVAGVPPSVEPQLDLLVSNPPFHSGAAKDSTPTLELIRNLPTVVRPGGQAWLVWNSHLPYLPALRAVGRTTIVARNRAYTVTRTIL
ncbi:class I SAM-dependent methyltransferase [Naumannella halotolerans]|uniref:16S rRNA (Guanine1207-N2)-methyltransferase n=1 Tax=Naumannella halotolerans TaxID=993414 RepID=A0A4V3EMG8_9ACTN|nr:methyltransferase [Naumannella halotolerans]TDT30068.1 16S rRNA (guanine1207-N2)-methyltransferase [Naumannella halotolerans]